MRRGGRVLYVNSALRESDWYIVPTAITTLMESLPPRLRRRGVFAWELTDALLRSADVIILDCHWFTSIPETFALLEWIRSAAPEVPVLLGGYTAQMFHEELLDASGADFVIRGDNERTFPPLVEALARGDVGTARGLPNAAGRGWRNPVRHVFRAEDYAGMRFGIRWFPAFRRRTRRINGGELLQMDHEFYQFPLLVASKGCAMDCRFCQGGSSRYRKLFSRPATPMPAGQLERLLAGFERDPETPALHLYFNWPVSEYRGLFASRRFNLRLKTHIDVFPELEDLEILAGAFRECAIYLSLGRQVHSRSVDRGVDYEKYLTRFPTLRFFASSRQRAGLPRRWRNRVLATTDGWVVPELFGGFRALERRAVETARRLILEDPRAWPFRGILRRHPEYARRLLGRLGLDLSAVDAEWAPYSPLEYVMHLNAC
jgi:hypothetical protein